MSELHEGRVAATFQIGRRIEDTQEAYEKEILGLEGMKSAFILALKGLEMYRTQVHQDGVQAKLPIKDAELGVKHVTACLEVLQKMCQDTEAKRLAALGGVDALKRVIADTKRLYDDEQAKLKQINEFEATSPKDMKQRPVGYMPKEHPLEVYQQQSDAQAQEPKKRRRARNVG